MKFSALILFSLILIQGINAQDSTAVLKSDTSGNNLFKFFKWKEKSKGEFVITVLGYDSVKKRNSAFQNFFYTTKDKPDGKLSVLNEDGKKVRECTYKNQLMFDEHWWFSTGEKEFDGTWSETTNENGDQVLEEYKWYYKNKKVRKHGYYTGISTTYYENGEKESEKTFFNGKPNGPYKSYYPGGKLQTEGQFSKGLKSGEWVHYNTDGTVRDRDQ